MSGHLKTLLGTVLLVAAGWVQANGPMPIQIAERVHYPVEVIGKTADLDESHIIQRPGASFIKLHFQNFVLPPGVFVEVSNPEGTEVYRYGRDQRSPYTYAAESGEDGRRSFSAMSISGDTAVIRVEGQRGNINKRLHKVMVDYYMEGYPDGVTMEVPAASLERDGILGKRPIARPESTCGVNERRDVQCWAGSHPVEFERSRPVARILINGSSLCTAWRVSDANRMFTNNHCVASSSAIRNTEVWFNYQRNACGGGGNATITKVTGDQLLATDYTLDYTLFTVANFSQIAGFGYFGLDPRAAVDQEVIYIPQHGSGNPKELAIESDQNSGGLCRVDQASVSGRGFLSDIGYFCDTIGGSSGSPVVARSSNRVLGLHHFGGCTNQGVKISEIWPQVSSYFNNQVPAGDNEDPGGNSSPVASFVYDCTGLDCSFDARGSSDADGNIVSYDWTFGDGSSASGVLVDHVYASGGSFPVTLSVTDNADATGLDTQTVSVQAPSTGLDLSVTAYKRRGTRFADLSWTGASGASVDIYRDGGLVITTGNDGFYQDQPNLPKRVKTATYQVCESASSTCSDAVTVSF